MLAKVSQRLGVHLAGLVAGLASRLRAKWLPGGVIMLIADGWKADQDSARMRSDVPPTPSLGRGAHV